jgi:hypothetical protein
VKLRRVVPFVALVSTAPFFSGCGAGGLLSVLSGIAQGSQWLSSLIDAGESGANAYLARHPGRAPVGVIESAVTRARLGVALLDKAIALGLRPGDHDYDAARKEALDAYDALWNLLNELGVLTAKPPLGGVETEAPVPDPVPLPTMYEVAKRL